MKLYGYRNGRTLRALWALEEARAEYEYVEVDVMRGEGREPWFLQLNPSGKVPVLIDQGAVITESAAICMHIAEKFPNSGLLPPAGTPSRTESYKWISFILTELDAPLWVIAKHRFGLPKERRVPDVIPTAIWECEQAAKVLATGVEQRAFLIGESFSVADIIAGHTLLWAKSTRIDFGSSALEAYLERLTTRDSLQRARDRAATRSPPDNS